MHPVDHHSREGHLLFGQPVDEVGGFAERIALSCCYDQERRVRRGQQGVCFGCSLPKASEQCLERGDEGAHVPQELAAEDLGHCRGHQMEAGTHQPQRTSGRRQQQSEERAVQEVAQVLRRV